MGVVQKKTNCCCFFLVFFLARNEQMLRTTCRFIAHSSHCMRVLSMKQRQEKFQLGSNNNSV